MVAKKKAKAPAKPKKTKKPYVWALQPTIISAVRRAFRTCPAYKQCLDEAKTEHTVKSKNGKPMRRVKFRCASCGESYVRKSVAVDHKEPVVSAETGFVDYNTYINRLYCDSEGLQVLCEDCHKIKSNTENAIRRLTKKTKALQAKK